MALSLGQVQSCVRQKLEDCDIDPVIICRVISDFSRESYSRVYSSGCKSTLHALAVSVVMWQRKLTYARLEYKGLHRSIFNVRSTHLIALTYRWNFSPLHKAVWKMTLSCVLVAVADAFVPFLNRSFFGTRFNTHNDYPRWGDTMPFEPLKPPPETESARRRQQRARSKKWMVFTRRMLLSIRLQRSEEEW